MTAYSSMPSSILSGVPSVKPRAVSQNPPPLEAAGAAAAVGCDAPGDVLFPVPWLVAAGAVGAAVVTVAAAAEIGATIVVRRKSAVSVCKVRRFILWFYDKLFRSRSD